MFCIVKIHIFANADRHAVPRSWASGREADIFLKRRLSKRFISWFLELRNFSIVIKNETTIERPWICKQLLAEIGMILHNRLTYMRGLLRCSFNYDGQCEGLRNWMNNKIQFPTLFVLIKTHLNLQLHRGQQLTQHQPIYQNLTDMKKKIAIALLGCMTAFGAICVLPSLEANACTSCDTSNTNRKCKCGSSSLFDKYIGTNENGKARYRWTCKECGHSFITDSHNNIITAKEVITKD